MVITRSITQLKANAANRPAGFLEYVMAIGRVEGDRLILDVAAQNQIMEKFPVVGQPGVFSVLALNAAKPYHPEGYVDFILERGKASHDVVVLDQEAQKDLNEMFPPKTRASIFKLASIRYFAQDRDPGYEEYILSRGVAIGEFLILAPEAYQEVYVKFPLRQKIKYNVEFLKTSAFQRPKGFVDYVLACGKIENGVVVVEPEANREILEKFPPLVNFKVAELKESAPRRPKGFVEYVLAHGTIEGEHVVLDIETGKEFNQKFPARFLPTPSEPSLTELAANFTGAMKGWAKAGFKTVERKVYEKRAKTCNSCEHWDAKARLGMGKCKICGCTSLKLWLASSKCPDKSPRW